MGLAEVLAQAISDSRARINGIAELSPGRVIQVELSWHPTMKRCAIVLRVVDHLPAWQSTASEGEAIDSAA